jgi:hypothetical protein
VLPCLSWLANSLILASFDDALRVVFIAFSERYMVVCALTVLIAVNNVTCARGEGVASLILDIASLNGQITGRDKFSNHHCTWMCCSTSDG